MSICVFETIWQTYKSTETRDLVVAKFEIEGKIHLLSRGFNLCWNSTDYLPDRLRKEVVAELNEWCPAVRTVGGGTEVVLSYWKERIWKVSQASRAFQPVLLRMIVMPHKFPRTIAA